jgi:hypothetical protein
LVCIIYQPEYKSFVKILNALPFYELWEHSILWPLENATESPLGILDERSANISLSLFAHCFRIFKILLANKNNTSAAVKRKGIKVTAVE